jgi:hypothetical protein
MWLASSRACTQTHRPAAAPAPPPRRGALPSAPRRRTRAAPPPRRAPLRVDAMASSLPPKGGAPSGDDALRVVQKQVRELRAAHSPIGGGTPARAGRARAAPLRPELAVLTPRPAPRRPPPLHPAAGGLQRT